VMGKFRNNGAIIAAEPGTYPTESSAGCAGGNELLSRATARAGRPTRSRPSVRRGEDRGRFKSRRWLQGQETIVPEDDTALRGTLS